MTTRRYRIEAHCNDSLRLRTFKVCFKADGARACLLDYLHRYVGSNIRKDSIAYNEKEDIASIVLYGTTYCCSLTTL